MRPVERIEIRQTVGFLGFHPVDCQLVSKARLDEFVFRVYALMRIQHVTRYQAVERLLYGW